VDNHHAGPSSGTLNQRKNRVLWANNQGQWHWKAMPKAALNSRYLNDDRKEHISAAVPGPSGILLHVENTAPGSGTIGLYATAATRGVFGSSDTGTGTSGYSKSGSGAWGYSESGHGVDALSESGLPLSVWGFSGGNLIEAWDEGAEPDDLRFKVTRSGDVHADGSFYAGQDVSVSGLLRVGQYSADPATCDGTTEGAIYFNTALGEHVFYGCNGYEWKRLSEGPTPGEN